MFFGVLFFPRNWLDTNDDSDLAGWLFLIGVVVGIASLFMIPICAFS